MSLKSSQKNQCLQKRNLGAGKLITSIYVLYQQKVPNANVRMWFYTPTVSGLSWTRECYFLNSWTPKEQERSCRERQKSSDLGLANSSHLFSYIHFLMEHSHAHSFFVIVYGCFCITMVVMENLYNQKNGNIYPLSLNRRSFKSRLLTKYFFNIYYTLCNVPHTYRNGETKR